MNSKILLVIGMGFVIYRSLLLCVKLFFEKENKNEN